MRCDLRLRIEGLQLEKLLNRAISEGARLGRIHRTTDRSITVETDQAGYGILLELCQRYGLGIRVLGQGGLPALVSAARRRATLPVGIAFGALLCWLFLSRIWLIDIRGVGPADTAGLSARVHQALEAMDIRPGQRDIPDGDTIARVLSGAVEGCSFTGVRRQGIRLLIETAAEVTAPQVYELNAGGDLFASGDGIVLSITVQSGVPLVKPGDAVRKGQRLIRGEELTGKDQTRPIAALGQVRARSWITGSATLPTRRIEEALTGQSSFGEALETPWARLDIIAPGEYERAVVKQTRFPIGGLFLPVELVRSHVFETLPRIVDLDEARQKSQLEALAAADAAAQFCLSAPPDAEIARIWTDYTVVSDGQRRADTVLEYTANIAVQGR